MHIATWNLDGERLALARALAVKLSARELRCLLTDNMSVLESIEPVA